jgi:hypothetical protein
MEVILYKSTTKLARILKALEIRTRTGNSIARVGMENKEMQTYRNKQHAIL